MVFQKYSLYPWLNAAENVAFGMRLQRMKAAEIKERTAYFLEVVGLSDAATKLPRELSGGMQQRVAIARALATNPSILLLDEPFGALDLQIRESMQDFLLKLWQRTSLTVLLITHDVEEALVLAQRVHVLAPNPGASFDPSMSTSTKTILISCALAATSSRCVGPSPPPCGSWSRHFPD